MERDMLSNSSVLQEPSTTELVWKKGPIVYLALVAMSVMSGDLSDQIGFVVLDISAEKVPTVQLLTLERKQTSALKDIIALKVWNFGSIDIS